MQRTGPGSSPAAKTLRPDRPRARCSDMGAIATSESGPTNPRWRAALRNEALQTALAKRAAGIPSYTVPEAAQLLSVSSEHLYRLIHADAFPAVHMALAGGQGRYIV